MEGLPQGCDQDLACFVLAVSARLEAGLQRAATGACEHEEERGVVGRRCAAVNAGRQQTDSHGGLGGRFGRLWKIANCSCISVHSEKTEPYPK